MMKRLFILFIPLLLTSCENNFLKNTGWRVIKFEIDSIHHLNSEDSLALTLYDPSKREFYQSFTDNTVEFRNGSGTDIYNYKLNGNHLIYYKNGSDTNTNVILKKTRDKLVIESRDGRIVTLKRI